ncbi:hypothetical protein PVAP13_7NG127527 [Panicum virgatum]|uniref:Uncharacterized protein n=1 Tax=Panicum virgatum TaxID=38727 RepID=A0A8T0PVR6_PANVG|nr:hypothetical protein PVAP13_7NG127527 [Panicum virgatum]
MAQWRGARRGTAGAWKAAAGAGARQFAWWRPCSKRPAWRRRGRKRRPAGPPSRRALVDVPRARRRPFPAPPGERQGHGARLDMAAASPLPPGPAVRRLCQAAAPPPPQPRRKEREDPPRHLDRIPRSGHWRGLAHRARWRREGGAAQGRISRRWRPRGGPHAQPQGPRAAILYARNFVSGVPAWILDLTTRGAQREEGPGMRGAEPRREPAMAAELEAPGTEPSRVAAAQPRRGHCPFAPPRGGSAAGSGGAAAASSSERLEGERG